MKITSHILLENLIQVSQKDHSKHHFEIQASSQETRVSSSNPTSSRSNQSGSSLPLQNNSTVDSSWPLWTLPVQNYQVDITMKQSSLSTVSEPSTSATPTTTEEIKSAVAHFGAAIDKKDLDEITEKSDMLDKADKKLTTVIRLWTYLMYNALNALFYCFLLWHVK